MDNSHWAFTIGAAVALGLVSGLAWFSIGERLDDAPIGNFLAWCVFPAVPPLVISLVIVLLSKPYSLGIVRSVVFFGCYYVAHWMPMGAILMFFLLTGTHF
ncbi:MAG: hypothetical protein RBS80_31285 [Thermoguttaceae bacterium]|nr:hypothetical protein [Thermoguttaceae bacterium]